MATTSANLDRLIVAQQAEIDRIRTQATTDLAAARQRLELLQRARLKVDDELDVLVDDLRKAGLWPQG